MVPGVPDSPMLLCPADGVEDGVVVVVVLEPWMYSMGPPVLRLASESVSDMDGVGVVPATEGGSSMGPPRPVER